MPRKRRGVQRKTRNVGRGNGRISRVGPQLVMQNLAGYRRHLVAQREELDGKISAIETAMTAMGSATMFAAPSGAGGARRGRPPGGGFRSGSLKEHIQGVLTNSGDIMAVKDITAGVLKSGYRSKNKTLAKSVGIALTEMKRVKKVGRGQFQAR